MNRLSLWFCLSVVGASSALGWSGPLAQFRTPLGDLEVELFADDKPVTVGNFLSYVQSGAYTNMFIHRWVPGFVIQGGGFFVATRSNTNLIDSVPAPVTITNEYNRGRTFSNTYGTLAMARVGGQTNSASSQWFFNLADNVALDSVDGGFTVFGRVLRGTNVLNRFNDTSRSNGIYRLPLGAPLNDLPVLSANPTYQDLVYVDISLLTVQLTSGKNGEREIAWRSVTNRTNHLEFTTNLPPVWRALLSTNGSGGMLRVTDSDKAAPFKFYRVRVDY